MVRSIRVRTVRRRRARIFIFQPFKELSRIRLKLFFFLSEVETGGFVEFELLVVPGEHLLLGDELVFNKGVEEGGDGFGGFGVPFDEVPHEAGEQVFEGKVGFGDEGLEDVFVFGPVFENLV